MSTWTQEELAKINAADELQIAPRRRDGSYSSAFPIWMVRDGDDLYVRSVNGRDAAWFRRAQATGEGRIAAGGVEKEVRFVECEDHTLGDRIDAEYRSKYRRYSASPVNSIVSPQARAATLKLELR